MRENLTLIIAIVFTVGSSPAMAQTAGGSSRFTDGRPGLGGGVTYQFDGTRAAYLGVFTWTWSHDRFELFANGNPLRLAPAFAEAARQLPHDGRPRVASLIDPVPKAHQLDPLSPITNTLAGQFLLYSGRYTEAIEALDKAFSIDPGFWVAHFMMGAIYERTGKPEAAIQSFEKATAIRAATCRR